MIAAILRKDWETLRIPILGVGSMQVAYALIMLQVDAREGEPVLQQLAQVLSWTWLMGAALLIILAVHQDAPRSVNQDWLTRPMSRGKMFSAKLLFALLFVQGGSVLADIIQGVGAGFPLPGVFAAALGRAVFLFLAFTLPALAVGAVTTRVGEALVVVLAGSLGVFAFTMLAIGTAGGYGNSFDASDFTGEGWLTNQLRYLVMLAGLAFTLYLQYQIPRRGSPRVALAATLAAVLLTQLLPWNLVFAVQERLSAPLQASKAIQIAWSGLGNGGQELVVREVKEGQWQLPVVIAGLGDRAWLIADKANLRVRNVDGSIIGHRETSNWSVLPVSGVAEADSFEALDGLQSRMRSGEINLQPDFSLTLMTVASEYSIPVESREATYPGWGRCSTRLAEGGDAIWLSCRQLGKGPTCARVMLVSDTASNPESRRCNPDYAPWHDHPLPDAVARWRITLPFRDPTGLVKYPVGPHEWRAARIVIKRYEPIAHFRRVLAPQFVTIERLGK